MKASGNAPLRGLTKCTGCGANVVWTVTTRGKKMLVDAEPSDKGNLLLSRQVDRKLVAIVARRGDAECEARYLSHFVTCPNAAQFRRRPRKRSGAMRQRS